MSCKGCREEPSSPRWPLSGARGRRLPPLAGRPSSQIFLPLQAPHPAPPGPARLSQPCPSPVEAGLAGAGNLCPGESLKSIFSARRPSPTSGGPRWGVWGEPRPRRACVSGVFGARAAGAPSPFLRLRPPRSPAAAPAPLAPPGVAGQHGPGRGAAKDRQEAGEDGGQEEDGEAAEFGLQPPLPTPGEARRVRAPRSPGGACWPGAQEARARYSGTRGRRGWGRAPRPGGEDWHLRVGVCVAPGRRG